MCFVFGSGVVLREMRALYGRDGRRVSAYRSAGHLTGFRASPRRIRCQNNSWWVSFGRAAGKGGCAVCASLHRNTNQTGKTEGKRVRE